MLMVQLISPVTGYHQLHGSLRNRVMSYPSEQGSHYKWLTGTMQKFDISTNSDVIGCQVNDNIHSEIGISYTKTLSRFVKFVWPTFG